MTHFVRKELKYPDKVQAFKLIEYIALHGQRNDYMVVAPSGRIFMLTNAEFKAIYKPQSVLNPEAFATTGNLIWPNPREADGGVYWTPDENTPVEAQGTP